MTFVGRRPSVMFGLLEGIQDDSHVRRGADTPAIDLAVGADSFDLLQIVRIGE
jgi:hypothetical protein